MPIFDQDFQAEYGLDLSEFDRFDRSWFPSGGTGPLTAENVWPTQQVQALDATQRALTTNLAMSSGIPFFAGQVRAQGEFLKSIPALRASSPIFNEVSAALRGGVSVERATEAALSIINEFGFSALQGAVEAAEKLAGVVDVVPLIGFFVKLGRTFGGIYYEALKPVGAKTVRVAVPYYDPDADYEASSVFHAAAGSRDWTGLFSPAPENLPLASGDAPRIFTSSRKFSQTAPHFAGRRTVQDGLWAYSEWAAAGPPQGLNAPPPMIIRPSQPQHFGFIPLWDGEGGQLWRGVLIDKKKGKEVSLIGDRLPTAQAMGLSMWRAAFNPTAPQIFFVDAVALQQRWLNYLVQLRRGLHLSHESRALKFLRDWKAGINIDKAGRTAARMWLSFAELEEDRKQTLSKKLDLRKRICDELALVFGWAKWNRDDDKMVGNYDQIMETSDEDYATMFQIWEAGPVEACVQLYNRQIAACQSATVLYSRTSDPAFKNAPNLRAFRARSFSAAFSAPQKRAQVDDDMLSPEFALEATKLKQPGTITATASLTPQIRSATYKPDAIWLGDVPPPSQWPSKDPTTSLKVQDSGGAGGAALLIAALGAGTFFMLR